MDGRTKQRKTARETAHDVPRFVRLAVFAQ